MTAITEHLKEEGRTNAIAYLQGNLDLESLNIVQLFAMPLDDEDLTSFIEEHEDYFLAHLRLWQMIEGEVPVHGEQVRHYAYEISRPLGQHVYDLIR